VDIASSCHGGTLVYRLEPSGSDASPLPLPPQLRVEVWTCPQSASTAQLIGIVGELAQRARPQHERLMSAQAAASVQAVAAARSGDVTGFISALRMQHCTLLELGQAAGVPIVTPPLVELEPVAEREAGVLLPAGAGGGDIALFVGVTPSSPALRAALAERAHHLLQVELAAPGVTLA
jgi:phosphomevalonate kinase